MYIVTDLKSGLDYKPGDDCTALSTEMNFQDKAKEFMMAQDGQLWLRFSSGRVLCLTCHYPGRFIVTKS